MPRPERIRQREKAVADGVDPATVEAQAEAPPPKPLTRKDEVAIRRTLRPDPPEEDPVDNAQQDNHPVRTGPVVDDNAELEVSRRVAKRMGWMPKEEWIAAGRNPETHVDAPDFLEFTPKRLETLQERQRRMGQVAEEQAEQARKEALAQARIEHDAAVRAGDVDSAGKAVDKIAKASGPPPQTVAWIAKNSWFNFDPDAKALAVSAILRAEHSGASIEDQLKAGEAAVRRRFPEHFDDVRLETLRQAPEPRREAKLSDVRAPAPNLTGGSRGGGSNVTKEKGWMDIPSADRTQMQQFVKKALRRGLTESEATGRLARTYWETKA